MLAKKKKNSHKYTCESLERVARLNKKETPNSESNPSPIVRNIKRQQKRQHRNNVHSVQYVLNLEFKQQKNEHILIKRKRSIRKRVIIQPKYREKNQRAREREKEKERTRAYSTLAISMTWNRSIPFMSLYASQQTIASNFGLWVPFCCYRHSAVLFFFFFSCVSLSLFARSISV